MRARRRSLLAAALAAALIAPFAALRAQALAIIDLRHRSADELLPLLRPLVEAGGALSGQGFQLFLRTTPANERQLRELIAHLDRAPRALRITVSQQREDTVDTQQRRIDGSVVIDSRASSARIGIGAGNEHGVGTRAATQTIQVLEGGRALISFGVAIPFTFRRYLLDAGGGAATEFAGTAFYEAVTGFAVRPLLNGDQVTLELAPVDATITARGVERSQLLTRVQGRLGEWIALGDADLREQAQTSGAGADAHSLRASQRGVWVRVEATEAR